ncbi:hypothetical protein J6590_029960 [Homalodisca vitripennis]|nr:hypothetical protein J6590_029960 [Homalodisca vitripennis]
MNHLLKRRTKNVPYKRLKRVDVWKSQEEVTVVQGQGKFPGLEVTRRITEGSARQTAISRRIDCDGTRVTTTDAAPWTMTDRTSSLVIAPEMESFRELEFLTLPCLYIFDVIMYCKSKCTLVRGEDIHRYETRGRDHYRAQHHRLTLTQHLPQQVGVRLINKLTESIKNSSNKKKFKTRVKLVSSAFYFVDEFMMSRWGL